MQFIKNIRKKLGYSAYKMAVLMGLPDSRNYLSFENSKDMLSLKKLIKLYRLSGDSTEEFMARLEGEVRK